MARRSQSISDRLFRALLHIYPQEFRDEYGEDMAQVFRDSRRDAVDRGGRVGVAHLWAHTILDLMTSAAKERLNEEGSMTMDKFLEALRSAVRKVAVAVAVIFAVGAIVLTVWVLRGRAVFASEDEAVRQLSHQTVGAPLESLPDQFPKNEKNQTATRFEELVEKIGFSQGEALSHRINGDMYLEYFTAELRTPSDAINPLPDSTEQFLTERHEALSALYRFVIQSDPPRWETNVSDLHRSFPILYTQRYIQNLILLDVLSKTRRGQTEAALEAFEASWKINSSLRERPEEIYQTQASQTAQAQAQVLRKMKAVPAAWQQRITEHKYQKFLLASLPLEAALSYRYAKHYVPRTEFVNQKYPIPFVNLVDQMGLPDYYRQAKNLFYTKANLGLYSVAQKYEQSDFDPLCSASDYEVLKDAYQKLPVWWEHNLVRWTTAVHTDLQLDLTRQVLETKQAPSRQRTALSTAPPEIKPCGNVHWVHRVDQNGNLTISLTDAPEWAQGLRYEIKNP